MTNSDQFQRTSDQSQRTSDQSQRISPAPAESPNSDGASYDSRWVDPTGYQKAIELLHQCRRDEGFLATPTNRANYRRIWGRDSSIIGLAALLSGETDLIEGCRNSLQTLAEYQGPHGEIPSNVDPITRRVSYGGTAGRVDANLWFLITCGTYCRITEDDDFLCKMLPVIEKTRYLLGAWEFNTRGLLYVPPTGDWADEYLQSGYVLYDQLLYLQAQREVAGIHYRMHDTENHELIQRINQLQHLIRNNYWLCDGEAPDDAYHKVLYEKGRQAAPERGGFYWLPFFSPFGYGYRFDAFANCLMMLLAGVEDEQCDLVDGYIDESIVHRDVMMLPAFDPVITPKDDKWDDLQVTFSHSFKNSPYEYHNGGLWPLVNGFYAAALAGRGKMDLAKQYTRGVHWANQLELGGQPWAFPEYVHGRDHVAGGTSPMGWSAAAAVIAEHACQGDRLFADKSSGSH